MKQDIRVDVTFPDHIKTKRLVKECGESAFRCLMRLWAWAAINRPSGDLSGLFAEEIEDEAGWTGEPRAFFTALISEPIKYIDVDAENDTCFLHDWKEHQPWLVGAKKRETAARVAAKARWNKKKMPAASDAHMPLSLPYPSLPKEKKKKTVFKKPSLEEVQAYCKERKNTIDPEAFIDFYESKGWKVGSSPMKNWQSAIGTWERRSKGNSSGDEYVTDDTDLKQVFKDRENKQEGKV